MLEIFTNLSFFGWRLFSRPPQPAALSVQWIIDHRSPHKAAQTQGATSLASLYRMYEYIALANNPGLRTEIEFFFNHAEWPVSEIPDPKDSDPEIYAILAVLPHFMVAAYNRLIERGLKRGSPAIIIDQDDLETPGSAALEKVPTWCSSVPKLETRLTIPDSDGKEPPEEALSPEFLDMNIAVRRPHVFFV